VYAGESGGRENLACGLKPVTSVLCWWECKSSCNTAVTNILATLSKIPLIPTSCAKRFYAPDQKLQLDKPATASYGYSMASSSSIDDSSVDFLHERGTQMASADALHEVLARVVEFASALVKCDSCL